MRRPLVMGNWKMNGGRADATALLADLWPRVQGLDDVDIVLCPPYPFLDLIGQHVHGTSLAYGAQNVSAFERGAYTGEVSAAMLRDVGCRYVIIGHSERRLLFGESNDVVVDKFRQATAEGLTPVLCVGESAAERAAGRTEQVVGGQIDAVLDALGPQALASAVVAYEPVWAIGSGQAASPADAQAVHRFIRQTIGAADPQRAQRLRILYGGSVKAQNAQQLFSQSEIDGGLIGGAALDASEFAGICKAANGLGSTG
ncbi:MAG: triose-phosphate isomerase [Acidiferrobacter sp.]